LPYAVCPSSILSLSLYSARKPPRPVLVQHTSKQFHPLGAHWQFHFYALQNVWDPKQSHRMVRGDVNQRPWALLYQWGRWFASLKSLQSRLNIRANTNVFLRSNVCMNFMCTEQESIYLGLENSNLFTRRDIEPSSRRLPIDSGLGPTLASWSNPYTRRTP
jgi:hypothetical protein